MRGGWWDPWPALLVALEARTYRNVTFLSTRMPLGFLYFTAILTLVGVGLSLLSFLVGIPLLALTFMVAWALARFERDLTRWWLRIEMPPMSLPPAPGSSLWQRI